MGLSLLATSSGRVVWAKTGVESPLREMRSLGLEYGFGFIPRVRYSVPSKASFRDSFERSLEPRGS